VVKHPRLPSGATGCHGSGIIGPIRGKTTTSPSCVELPAVHLTATNTSMKTNRKNKADFKSICFISEALHFTEHLKIF
jgi:hypothetical protein